MGEFSANVGPYLGYKIGATAKTTTKATDTTVEADLENVKTLDYGIQFGATAQIEQFTVGAQYSLGLANTAGADSNESKNNTISVIAGYNF